MGIVGQSVTYEGKEWTVTRLFSAKSEDFVWVGLRRPLDNPRIKWECTAVPADALEK